MTRSIAADARISAWDTAVEDLERGLPVWRAASVGERVDLLHTLRRRIAAEGAGMAAAMAEAQGFDPKGFWASEPWANLFGMTQTVRSLEWVLSRVAAGRDPLPGSAVRRRPDGRVVVEVFPTRWDEKLLFNGWHARVWMPPGMTPEQVRARAASAYRGAGFDGPGVALLLAAGNVPSLTVSDLLHLLYGQGCVVAVKMNPVLAHLRPVMERLFADFTARGWVRFVDETPQAGAYLAHHPGVDRVHMTGSAATYDAIRWGSDGRAADRRAAGTPLLDKPFTAELGGVSPLIVVPGDWSDAEVRLQADRIAYAKLFNCGHICCSPQVLVLPDGWPQAEPLLAEIRRLMSTAEPRVPYYPGTDAKVTRAIADRDGCDVLLDPGHRVLVDRLDPATDDAFFREEVFADVLGVVRLPAPSVDAFLTAATGFANEQLAGTLAATVFVDPATMKRHARSVGRAVSDLRYGSVGLNEWAVFAANLGYTTWGAFPGHTPQAIGSGTGTVINAFLLPDPQKTVLSNAFRPPLKPIATMTNRTATTALRRLVSYLATDDVKQLPGVMAAALRA
jgi:acyl-CoA reductase-like NAD-dependent aldehyde dehydrogenase